MSHIGEFRKKSMILLELLTIDQENNAIAVDMEPTATIEHSGRNGLQEVDNVTLEKEKNGNRYTYRYQIPDSAIEGKYQITYQVIVNKKSYQTQESFSVVSDFYLQAEEDPEEEPTPIEEPIQQADGYIMPSDFQIPSSINVEGNDIILSLEENALYNYSYQVVLRKEITSNNGNSLSEDKQLTFTSSYKPFFATPAEVRLELGTLYRYFSLHDIYSAIRDESQKAMQLLGNTADPNASQYRELRETDTSYFPSQKYVLYASVIKLLRKLMIHIMDGPEDGEDNGGLGSVSDALGMSMTLGDFSVDDGSSSTSSSGAASSEEETILEKLQIMLRSHESDLKFWKDAMMGHNRRGYASPSSASYRTAAGSPEGRDF